MDVSMRKDSDTFIESKMRFDFLLQITITSTVKKHSFHVISLITFLDVIISFNQRILE